MMMPFPRTMSFLHPTIWIKFVEAGENYLTPSGTSLLSFSVIFEECYGFVASSPGSGLGIKAAVQSTRSPDIRRDCVRTNEQRNWLSGELTWPLQVSHVDLLHGKTGKYVQGCLSSLASFFEKSKRQLYSHCGASLDLTHPTPSTPQIKLRRSWIFVWLHIDIFSITVKKCR